MKTLVSIMMATLMSLPIISIMSCNKSESQMWGTDYQCWARVCDSLTVRNYKLITEKCKYKDKEVEVYSREQIGDGNEKVQIADYLIRVDVGPGKLRGFNVSFSSQSSLEPDADVEALIYNYINNSSTPYVKTRAVAYDIEYRLEKVDGIKVYPLIDGKSEEPIPIDNVCINGTPTYQSFIISTSKLLVGEFNEEISVKKYLTLNPLMAATLFLRLPESGDLSGKEVRFAVELDMNGGKTLKDTTSTVSFTPAT